MVYLLTLITARHLQLGVTVDTGPNLDKDKELWVLLTRHIADSERTGELIALSVQDEESVVDTAGTSLKASITRFPPTYNGSSSYREHIQMIHKC